jgi:hypothetical protein
MTITVLDVALAWGAKQDDDGSINGAEFDRVGLPLFGGCQCCHASIAAYNAYPSQSGFLRCEDCIGDMGFNTVKEFENWDREPNEGPVS